MATSRIAKVARRWLRRDARSLVEHEADLALLRASPYFDAEFYRATYPDVARAGIDPAEHYLRFGAAEGRNPSTEFNTAFYLAANPDVAAAGVNALMHFIRNGAREGRAPRELLDRSTDDVALPEARAILASGCFDSGFYVSQVKGVIEDGQAIDHYIAVGAAMGLRPAPWFDSAFYLQAYKDVEQAGVNPFHHFLTCGWIELRCPSAEVDALWLLLMNPVLRAGEIAMPQFLRDHFGDAGVGIRSRRTYSHNDKVRLISVIPMLLGRDDVDHRTLYSVGKAAALIGAHELSVACHERAADARPDNVRYLSAVSESLRRVGDWPGHAKALERLLDLNHDPATQLRKLGYARRHGGDLPGAAEAFRRSLELRRELDTAYQLGIVYEDLGDQALADVAFSIAMRLAKKARQADAFGAGLLHEAVGDSVRAARAFERHIALAGETPELLEKLARAYERSYEWQSAEAAYRRAAKLADGFGLPKWHYRVGFANERLGRHEAAATAYRAAIRLSATPPSAWFYRLGRMLESCGKDAAACRAYLLSGPPAWGDAKGGRADKASDVDVGFDGLDEVGYLAEFVEESTEVVGSMIDAASERQDVVARWLSEGESRLGAGEWAAAAACFGQAAARDDSQSPLPYGRAGSALLRAGRPEEAVRALRSTRQLGRPYLAGLAAVESDPAARLAATYLEYVAELAVQDSTILYESFSGLSVACNPLAIFRAIVDAPAFAGFTHVWVINDSARVPADIAGRQEVVLVRRESFAYLRYLATARYLVNNSGFPGYFIRRPDQKYLATWHGTPLKTLGKEQKYKFYDHKRTQRNFLHATHIISPNPHTTRVQLDSYDIRTLYRGMFAETGYPRVDLTVNADQAQRTKLMSRIGLDEHRKVVLYAPTWRGTPDEVWFDFDKLQQDLVALAQLDCQVIFRGHSWLERAINVAHVDCNVVPADIDTNELLSIVDVLVTDYSSVFFDFLATGKPVIYYIYDLEDYTRDRGLYFDMEEMPGFKCTSMEELSAAVREALALDPADGVGRGEFSIHDDGNASRRVVEFFFNDNEAHTVRVANETAKPRVLMYAGTFAAGERTTLAVEIAHLLDEAGYEVVVAFTPSAVELAGGVNEFRQLPRNVVGLPRYGNVLMTPEEKWLRRRYEEGAARGDACDALMQEAYKREFYRMAGPADFHASIVFDGVSGFWTNLLLKGCPADVSIRVVEGTKAVVETERAAVVRMEDVRNGGASRIVDLLRHARH